MLPRSTNHDFCDGCGLNSEFPSQLDVADNVAQRADGDDLFLCKNSGVHFLATRSTLFGLSVFYVVEVASEEQVRRAYARGVIASVEHQKRIVKISEMQNPRCAVRLDCARTKTAAHDSAIPILVSHAANPNPTISKVWHMLWHWSVFVYLTPKSLFEGVRKSLWKGGVLNKFAHSSFLCSLGLQARRAFSFWHFNFWVQA